MNLSAQLNRLIEDDASHERLGAWLSANAVTVSKHEGMVAIPIVDMIDMPRFIEQRRKNADQ
jgi:hypothetical protein